MSRSERISLLLVDDHPIVLDGLESLFGLEPDFDVVARCVNGDQVVTAVRQHRPDVVILDLQMRGMNGLAVLRALRDADLECRVVLLTVALNDEQMMEALRLGVRGMILKEMAPRLIVQCVRKVHAGEQWFEKTSVGRALERLLNANGAPRSPGALTTREMEVVRMVARGLRNKEIAAALSLSEGTVKIHLHNVYEKLGVDGRVALTLLAQQKGLI